MSHTHGHSHSHGSSDYNRAFAIGVFLNIGFVIIEATYGVMVDSLSLIADAGHNLSDVASLLLAWGAAALAAKAATEKRTYGFRKVTVMASLASAILLLIALGGIAWEAIGRFGHPQPVEGMTVIVVAGIGVLINTATALLFVRGQHDLNIRGAFLHMAADAGVSLAVVLSGVVILWKGWLWVDPLMSLLIVVVILLGTIGLLRDSVDYAIDAVPRGVDMPALRRYLQDLTPVHSLHDLHVWPLSTTETALTVHLVVDPASEPKPDHEWLGSIQAHLHEAFSIEHATIQLEGTGQQDCLNNDCC